MYVQYGTFVKPASPGGCLAAAEQAMVAQGLLIVKGADGADFLVIGGNDPVTVTVVAVPQPGGTWVVVSASSPDPNIAAQARDVIRAMIEQAPVA
ncbi:hypothetical protein OJF2_11420 [Aquisphaera giovannonii]|uniref:Uncharacterized protein n=1 Tax=Aquisphaera giovannonii TaxID=406548 RepID=A0A5B9VWB4_9BACT|nr:hypothetical protein [Aquisphaera giovannonii]QEH32663.1 hypothetical protein OJF2_11420 [Aquisphaera giovannonii]